jgi:hypothetical protein
MPKVSKETRASLPTLVTGYLETVVANNGAVSEQIKGMTAECIGKLHELAVGVMVEREGTNGLEVYKTPPNVAAITTILKLTTTTPVEASMVIKNLQNDNQKSPEELALMQARAELARAEKIKIEREIEMMNNSMITEDVAAEVIMAVCNAAVAFMHGIRLDQMPRTNEEKADMLQRFVHVIDEKRDEALGVLDEAKQANQITSKTNNDDDDDDIDIIEV